MLTSSCSRSNLPAGVKSKWEERMEKTKKEKAIKALERELKDDKQAEIQRSVLIPLPLGLRTLNWNPSDVEKSLLSVRK